MIRTEPISPSLPQQGAVETAGSDLNHQLDTGPDHPSGAPLIAIRAGIRNSMDEHRDKKPASSKQRAGGIHMKLSRVVAVMIPKCLLAAGFFRGICAAQSVPIQLSVDLRDAPKKIVHAIETIPVTPGELTLVYPKWIPGEHGPTGPIDDQAGLFFTANGLPVPWHRDAVDMYSYHLTVPNNVTSLQIKMDFLATPDSGSYAAGGSTSGNLAVLSWNTVVLYPYRGSSTEAKSVFIQPSITFPEGWNYGTALESTSVASSTCQRFKAVNLEELIDSPVLSGRFFHEVELTGDPHIRHFLDMASDGPEDLALSQTHISQLSKLVAETGALYRSRHYGSYHFLVTLSDQVAHFGLEHHQSSDDRVEPATFIDERRFALRGELLPHELTHSWNGKYRRPDGLATPNYQVPIVTDLLWVYEGLTTYLGDVLAVRCGIWTPELFRERLAVIAATYSNRPGRTWRSLQDTARMAQVLYLVGGAYDNWRLGTDFHDQGELLWLEVDTKILELTRGKKSLNNFIAAFFGSRGDTPPIVYPYNFEDIIAGLDNVVAYDWAGMLETRLDVTTADAPLSGIFNGGYQVSYTDRPNKWEELIETGSGVSNTWFSLEMAIDQQGFVRDVKIGGIADSAGFGPGMKIMAMNGREFTPNLLRYTLEESKSATASMEFIVSNSGFYKILHLDYHNGPRYPHIDRIATPARLDDILKPLVN